LYNPTLSLLNQNGIHSPLAKLVITHCLCSLGVTASILKVNFNQRTSCTLNP